MATLYKHSGAQVEVTPANGRDFQLDELYKLLDTDIIQVVHGIKGHLMIIDEEGKLKDGWEDRVNLAATMQIKHALLPNDLIVGHALVCKKGEFK